MEHPPLEDRGQLYGRTRRGVKCQRVRPAQPRKLTYNYQSRRGQSNEISFVVDCLRGAGVIFDCSSGGGFGEGSRRKGSGAPSVARVTDLFSIVMELQYKGLGGENKGAVSRGVGVGFRQSMGGCDFSSKADHLEYRQHLPDYLVYIRSTRSRLGTAKPS